MVQLLKKDIEATKDIELLVTAFYEKVKSNPVTGPIFTTIIKINRQKHLRVMHDFWENALFYTGIYSDNPMASYQKLHRIFPLNEEHFLSWNSLFTDTVDELFEGEKATLAKQRAVGISTVVKIKILRQNTTVAGNHHPYK